MVDGDGTCDALNTVTRGRRGLKRMHYLLHAQPGKGGEGR
jgi:hypothetical protein